MIFPPFSVEILTALLHIGGAFRHNFRLKKGQGIWHLKSGYPELLGSPRTSPEVPRTSPEVFRRLPRKFSHCGTLQQSRGSPEVPQTSPEVPRTSPEVSRTSPEVSPFSGKPDTLSWLAKTFPDFGGQLLVDHVLRLLETRFHKNANCCNFREVGRS